MVSTVVKENGVKSEKAVGLPSGNYHLVGWDVDTTGRRLIDEICQIAAYIPASSFSQYVMPYRELNPAARRRHNMKVVTIGRFRMLKDSKTGKVLKTKSEISALADFVQWLETVGSKTGDGVILVSHEPRKVAAPLLLEALRRYNMLEKFSAIVKGFVNGYSVAELKCAKTVCSFSLRTLSRVLLDKEEKLDRATERARLAFQIVQHLCGGDDRQGSGDGSETAVVGLMETMSEFAKTIPQEEDDLATLKIVLNRQKSLQPVFASLLQRERKRAINLRRLLAEAGIEYDELSLTHQQNGNDGVVELITNKIVGAKPKEVEDLKALLQEHFNPQPKLPSSETKPQKSKAAAKINGADTSGSSTPDVTASSPVKTTSSQADDAADSPPTKEHSPQHESSAAVEPETTTLTTPAATATTNTSESVVAT